MITTKRKAGISSKFLETIAKFFARNTGNIGYELVQNSWRANATKLDVEFVPIGKDAEDMFLRITDNGHGTDFGTLLTAGESDWSESVASEHPAGMGMFSLVGILENASVTLTSQRGSTFYKIADLKAEHFSGAEEQDVEESDQVAGPQGTTIIMRGKYSDLHLRAAFKSIVKAIAKATAQRHLKFFDPENCYTEFLVNVDVVKHIRIPCGGAYSFIGGHGKPAIKVEAYPTTNGSLDVYRVYNTHPKTDSFSTRQVASSYQDVESGEWSMTDASSEELKKATALHPMERGKQHFRFIFHGKAIKAHATTKSNLFELMTRNKEHGLRTNSILVYYTGCNDLYRDQDTYRAGAEIVVFVNDGEELEMTHPERDEFTHTAVNVAKLNALVENIYKHHMDAFITKYKRENPTCEPIMLHALDDNMQSRFQFCNRLKITQRDVYDGERPTTHPIGNTWGKPILTEGSTLQVACPHDTLLWLFDQGLVSKGDTVLECNVSSLQSYGTQAMAAEMDLTIDCISAMYPTHFQGKPIDEVDKDFQSPGYDGDTVGVCVVIWRDPGLTMRRHRLKDGEVKVEEIHEEWGEPLVYQGNALPDLPDDPEDEHIFEEWHSVEGYSGEDHMVIVMSEEQAMNCLGVYDEDNLVHVAWGVDDRCDVDTSELHDYIDPSDFAERLMGAVQIAAGVKTEINHKELADAMLGTRHAQREMITALQIADHPCTKHGGNPIRFNAVLETTATGFKIVKSEVVEEEADA